MKIIINADDFGYNHEVNLAIVEAFSKGWITNTTIMANMPGYDEAVEIAKTNGFFDKVGLHLNFFEGLSLTEGMRNDSIFSTEEGMTSYKILHELSPRYKFLLPKTTMHSLAIEADKQMERYVKSGFTEFHLDSHGHSHTQLAVWRSIVKTIKKYEFRTVRLSLNLFTRPIPSIIKLYKKLFNRLVKSKFRTTLYFTSAADFIDVAKNLYDAETGLIDLDKYGECVCEIMVHPVYDKSGRLVNMNAPDFEEIFRYIKKDDLISFLDI